MHFLNSMDRAAVRTGNFISAFVALALVAMSSSSAFAQTFFPNNAEINVDLIGPAEIGHDGAGGNTSPTVNLVTGGLITGDTFVFNSSRFNLNGGSLGKDFGLSQTARGVINSGSVADRVFVRGESGLSMNGGTVGGTVFVENSAFALISGGTITGGVTATGGSRVTITGGTINGPVTGNVTKTQPAPIIDVAAGVGELILELDTTPVLADLSEGPSSDGEIPIDSPQLIFHGEGFLETESTNFTDPRFPGKVFDLNFVSAKLFNGEELRFVPLLVEHGTDPTITFIPLPPAALSGGLMLGGLVLAQAIRRFRRGRR